MRGRSAHLHLVRPQAALSCQQNVTAGDNFLTYRPGDTQEGTYEGYEIELLKELIFNELGKHHAVVEVGGCPMGACPTSPPRTLEFTCWLKLDAAALLSACPTYLGPLFLVAQMVRLADLDSRITALNDGTVDFVLGCEWTVLYAWWDAYRKGSSASYGPTCC